MNVTWLKTGGTWKRLLLAGDIGGTNTSLAAVAYSDSCFDLVAKYHFDSCSVTDFKQVISSVLSDLRSHGKPYAPDYCCVSAAGPVRNNGCRPTNLEWEIDGDAISRQFDIPVRVLNDFEALSFGLPLLDLHDTAQVIAVPQPDGTMPAATGASWAVAGAGTGLGVGHLIKRSGAYLSLPSEGGHSLFSPFDDETEELWNYVRQRYEESPGTEPFLSGRGMANIFDFYRDVKGMVMRGVLEDIDALPDPEKPPLITRFAREIPELDQVMRLFIRIYGRFAGKVALFLMPTSGMFIAGGIVVRHSTLFLKESLFIREFLSTYNPVMKSVLSSIPVYIVNDYSISLLGAANAAVSQG